MTPRELLDQLVKEKSTELNLETPEDVQLLFDLAQAELMVEIAQLKLTKRLAELKSSRRR